MKPILIAGLSALTMMMCPEFANGQGILKRLKDGVQKEATRIVQDEVDQATNRVFTEGEKVLKGGSGKKSTNQKRTDTDSSVSTTSKTSSNTTADKPLYTFDPNIDPRLQVQRDFEIYVHNREKKKWERENPKTTAVIAIIKQLLTISAIVYFICLVVKECS